MNELLFFAAHNALAALVLALVVYPVTRVWRNPPAAHLLWLVVLLKLIGPPVIEVNWLAGRLPAAPPARSQTAIIVDMAPSERQKAEARPTIIEGTAAERPTTVPAVAAVPASSHTTRPSLAEIVGPFWRQAQPGLVCFWGAGAVFCALLAAARIVRFERRLRETLPAPNCLQQLVVRIAASLGLNRAPDVRCAECVEVPLVWWAGGRPTIVLPIGLCRRLDDQRLALILAHEIAHLRRRDHWVRIIELIVSIVYWWNPLVRLIRRELHQAEDLACDAWVRWAFPDCTKCYAETVLETAESLSASQLGAQLLPASPLLRSLSLKARIEMILESRFAPRVSKRSLAVVVLVALLVLPAFIQTSRVKARAGNDEGSAVASPKVDHPAPSEFPHVVRFEQGATRFAGGDKITILEVRGTDETFAPGNIYSIKGTYTLGSRDRATLLASITATDSDGKSGSLKVQTLQIERGEGTFTLLLPMSYRGLPHVSFYPAGGGEGFGGNYFGTGDSVLKQWWRTGGQAESGSHAGANAGQHRALLKLLQGTEGSTAGAEPAVAPDTAFLAKRFKHRVPFEIGRSETQAGGRIEIREVWGTRPQIEIGGQYLVRGKYRLPPGQPGRLYFYATASGPWGETASLDLQATELEGQEGEFALIHGMAGPGSFHLILTDPDRYSQWFANVYFGTGENVQR
jgi:beta-lactamase regulating signal transducer with metallopeptidase domain